MRRTVHHEQPIQRIHRPFSTYPCCTKSQPSRCQRASLPPMTIPSQGNRTVHVLLMEHVDDAFRILVPVQKAKDVCPAHELATVLDLNLGVLDFQPRNIIFGRRIEFCEKDDCQVRSEVDLDDVREALVDLENVGLADLMKKLRNRAKVVNKQRRRYLKRWLENGIQQLGQ